MAGGRPASVLQRLVCDPGLGALRTGGGSRRLAPALRQHLAIVDALLVAGFVAEPLLAGLYGRLPEGWGLQSYHEEKQEECCSRGFSPRMGISSRTYHRDRRSYQPCGWPA